MIDLMVAATWGLASMALYGGTGILAEEHKDEGLSLQSGGNYRTTDNLRGQLNAEAEAAGLLINCPNGNKEHIARAIRLPDGTELAMVEPIWQSFCYDDHFIIKYPPGSPKAGTLERWDVGYTERIPAYGSGRPPPDMSIQAIPRQITDFAKLRNGDDGGGGVGSLITPPPMPMTVTMAPMTMTMAMPDPMTMTMAMPDPMTMTMAMPDPMTMTMAMPDPMTMTVAMTGETDTSTASAGGSSSNTGLLIGGAIVAGAVVYFVVTEGAFSDLSFTPHYSFYHSDGGNSYYYGARWDYHKDNSSAYWFTGQNGSGGVLDNWRYGSGASWTNGVWKAAYNGIGDSETMDADMSLSLIKNSGIWTLKTGLGAFAHIDEVNNTDMNYFLRAQADAQYQHWTLSQAAYYNGDSGQFNLDFVRNW